MYYTREERVALRRAGYQVCPTHIHYIERLPEGLREPVDGYEDPAIRPQVEFYSTISSCKECIKLRQNDRSARKLSDAGVERRIEYLEGRRRDIEDELDLLYARTERTHT